MFNYGDARLPDSFWEKVSPEPNSGCWLWTGNVTHLVATNGETRGTLTRDGKRVLAHRHAYSTLVGPLTIHENLFNTCGISECCNPAHHKQSERTTEERERRRAATRRYMRKLSPIAKRARQSAILKSMYGITLDEYEAMIERQGNKCQICSSVFEVGGDSRRRPCIDHCHRSGDVRGILCSNCNTGIGYFGEDPSTLEQAAAYARSFAQRPLSFKVKEKQTITCMKCGDKGHNSRTCKKAA